METTARTDSPHISDWTFYRTPGEAWDAMYAACEKAERTIEFEQYILELT